MSWIIAAALILPVALAHGGFNGATVLGIILTIVGVTVLVSRAPLVEEIDETHPDALGSLDLRERESRG